MVDFAQRLKELREKKAAEALAIKQSQETDHEQSKTVLLESKEANSFSAVIASTQEATSDNSPTPQSQVETKPDTTINTIGTARTSEIDHLAFMSQLQELQEAIHTQHPKMPVLLMLIHKHLRTDPELVTTLSEEEIGVIVNGLKIHTKTELTGTVLKAPSSRAKKLTLSTDMF